MSETARRIRILAECSKVGVLTKEDIAKKYTSQDMVSIRLKRLVNLGALKLCKGRYVMGNKVFLLVSKTVFKFQRFIFPSK